MSLRNALGSLARDVNHRFGIQALLNGEPRPPAGGFDLKGEKFLDWGFVCANLPHGRKRALEIGPGRSPIIPAMLAVGYDVTAIDIASDLSKQFAGIRFIKGDFTAVQFEAGFDVVVACSTVEHVGLSGRYGSVEDADGDLKTMRKVHDLLEPHGLLFLTVPMGVDGVHRPFHRVYGRQRLPRLLEGFQEENSHFLVKIPHGPWHVADRDAALDYPASARRYALGEFVLRKTRMDGIR
jgi:SAM-dependent methyltransferase